MEKGLILNGYWSNGEKPKLYFYGMIGRSSAWVTAWKCPKCGKIELEIEKKN